MRRSPTWICFTLLVLERDLGAAGDADLDAVVGEGAGADGAALLRPCIAASPEACICSSSSAAIGPLRA
eukprot:8465222-Pyramimonas_sp.AAC.1